MRNFTSTVFRNFPAEATGQKCHLKRNELLPVSWDAESYLPFDWNFNGWLSGSEVTINDNVIKQAVYTSQRKASSKT